MLHSGLTKRNPGPFLSAGRRITYAGDVPWGKITPALTGRGD